MGAGNRIMRKSLIAGLVLLGVHSMLLAQGERPHGSGPGDVRYSVFGPPRPSFWEFQLSRWLEDGERATTFNFYRKDQRNKTIFFKISDNDRNNRNEFRTQEVTGGVVLFPVDDDDRYQLDLGGTYDRLKDTTLTEKAFTTRITFRPEPWLWLRAGYEMFDGITTGSRPNAYRNISSSTLYAAGKVSYEFLSAMAVVGKGRVEGVDKFRVGGGAIIEGPWNTFALGGYIKSDDTQENVRTLAFGRWAPFRPDGLPSAVFIWKHRELYDFQIGGLFYGETNLLVRPALIGMSQGMFVSSMAMRENSELRQAQLMSITDDYRNADYSVFYVMLRQSIPMVPGKLNHIGFRAFQFFRNFTQVEFAGISGPILGVFYNEETEPQYIPAARTFTDKESSYWSLQLGATIAQSVIINSIVAMDRPQWRLAISYILR
jgi:hypothetical protein